MKIEILSEKENPLLKRKEFEVRITHDAATPSRSEIRKKVAGSKDIGKGTIIVDSFKSKYGSRETLGTVKVYQTKERALEIEPRYRLIKNELIDTEGKPGEVKPEEKKEEPKQDVKEKPAKEPEEKPKKEAGEGKKEAETKEGEKPEKEEVKKKDAESEAKKKKGE